MLGENANKQKNAKSLKDWVDGTQKNRQTLENETYLPASIDLSITNFDEFYNERKKLLIKQLCEVLGVKLGQMDSNNQDEIEVD